MKKLVYTLAIICVVLPLNAFSILLNGNTDMGNFKSILASEGSYHNIYDYVYLTASLLNEESAGFSDIELTRVSILGNSWKQSKFFLNGFNITDSFFTGTPAITLPYTTIFPHLEYDENPSSIFGGGIHFKVKDEKTNYTSLTLSSVIIPFMGNKMPFAVSLMRKYSSSHPIDRSDIDEDIRSCFGENAEASLVNNIYHSNYSLKTIVGIEAGKRTHLNFVPHTGEYSNTFNENYTRLNALVIYTPLGSLVNSLSFAMEYFFRDALYEECFYEYNETATLNSFSFFSSLNSKYINTSLLLKTFSIEHRDLYFTREIKDPDGRGRGPYYPDASYLSASLNASITNSLLYATVNNNAVLSMPKTSLWTNTLVYNASDYGFARFSAAESSYYFGDNRLGLFASKEISVFNFSANSYLSASYVANSLKENTLTSFNWGVKLLSEVKPTDRWNILLSFSKVPYSLTPEEAKILNPSYINGEFYLGEESSATLSYTTGGKYLSVSSNIQNPFSFEWAIGSKHVFSDFWSWNTQFLFKRQVNTYWIVYEDTNKEGYFQNGIFYHNEGQSDYILTNYPFEKKPFYFALNIQLLGTKTEKYLLNLAFTYHLTLGASVSSAGFDNDVASISYAGANPNTTAFYYGSYDLDNNFKGIIEAGFTPFKGLWLFFCLRYKDGVPFSFVNYHENNEVAYIPNTRRANLDLYPGGPREDARWNVDAKIRYTLNIRKVSISLYAMGANIFDIATEMSENFNVEKPLAVRASLELVNPRSLTIGTEVKF